MSLNVTIINRYVWETCWRPAPSSPAWYGVLYLPPPKKMLLCQAAVCHSQADSESRLFPIGTIVGCRVRIVRSPAVGAG